MTDEVAIDTTGESTHGHNGISNGTENGNGHHNGNGRHSDNGVVVDVNFEVKSPEKFSIEDARTFISKHKLEERALNPIVARADIPAIRLNGGGEVVQSTFNREVKDEEGNGVVNYPESVINAVKAGINSYSETFDYLIKKERELSGDETSYSAGTDLEGNFKNLGLQVDMGALPKAFLDIADKLPQDVLEQAILERVFEFENSLAMYNFMRGIFTNENGYSYFKENFDGGLDRIREASGGKKIAIATLTEPKYNAIRMSELGITEGEEIDEQETRNRIGFDAVMSPSQVEEHLRRIDVLKQELLSAEMGDDEEVYNQAKKALAEADDTIFYVRSSLPVKKLADPFAHVDIPPIVQNTDYLRLLRERSLTPNVDLPALDSLPLNDTKEYMEYVGMALTVNGIQDLLNPEVLEKAQEEFMKTKIERAVTLISFTEDERYLEKKGYRWLDSKRVEKQVIEGEEEEVEVESYGEHGMMDYVRENGKALTGILKQIRGRMTSGDTFEHAFDTMKSEIKGVEDIGEFLYTIEELLDAVEDVENLSIAESIGKLLDTADKEGKLAQQLSDRFINYLAHRGVQADEVSKTQIRVKPMTLSYGAYGHLTGTINKSPFWRSMIANIDDRGPHVLQTEVSALEVNDLGSSNGGDAEMDRYGCIDRLFFVYNPVTGEYDFINGFRNHIPMNHLEARKNNFHGNKDAFYTEIQQEVA